LGATEKPIVSAQAFNITKKAPNRSETLISLFHNNQINTQLMTLSFILAFIFPIPLKIQTPTVIKIAAPTI
jgi:hypothetical protein